MYIYMYMQMQKYAHNIHTHSRLLVHTTEAATNPFMTEYLKVIGLSWTTILHVHVLGGQHTLYHIQHMHDIVHVYEISWTMDAQP